MSDFTRWSSDLTTVPRDFAPEYKLSTPGARRCITLSTSGEYGSTIKYTFDCRLADLWWPRWCMAKNEVIKGTGWQIDLEITEVANRGTEWEEEVILESSRPLAQVLEVGENHLGEALALLGRKVFQSLETMEIMLKKDFICFSPSIESDAPSVADTTLTDRLS